MKKASFALAVLAMLAVLSGVCRAADGPMPPPSGGPREACHQDMQKFCGGVQPGEGRIRECMKAHESEVSAQCREAMQHMPPHMRGGPGGPPPQGGNQNPPPGAPPSSAE